MPRELNVGGNRHRNWSLSCIAVTLYFQVSSLLDCRTTRTLVITRSPQTSLFLLMKYETRIAAIVTYLPNYIPYGWTMSIKGGVQSDGASGERIGWNCMWKVWAGIATALIQAEAHFKPSQGRFHPVLMSQQHQTKLKEKYAFTDYNFHQLPSPPSFTKTNTPMMLSTIYSEL